MLALEHGDSDMQEPFDEEAFAKLLPHLEAHPDKAFKVVVRLAEEEEAQRAVQEEQRRKEKWRQDFRQHQNARAGRGNAGRAGTGSECALRACSWIGKR